jgi:hypothetical protein
MFDFTHASTSHRLIATPRTRFSSPAHSTDVAAIAGGVVGGVAFVLILSFTIFIVIRRRFRQARLTFVGEDGLDGRDSTQPRRSEEDMPPPNYRRIFPSDSGAAGDQAQAGHEAPVYARPWGIWRISRKRPGKGTSAPDRPTSNPSAMPAAAVFDAALPQAAFDRAILNASAWTWKGVPPRKATLAVPQQQP